jgi:hypothetical protein
MQNKLLKAEIATEEFQAAMISVVFGHNFLIIIFHFLEVNQLC